MMRLYFVRHGESEANRFHVISNRDERLRRTKRYRYGLTPTGQQQAHTLAQTLQQYPITAIFTSPLCRAIETAEIFSQALGLPHQSTDALREYDCGILEGKSDPESWRLHQEIAEDWLLHQNWERRPAQGESFLDIKHRFLPFFEQLTQTSFPKDTHILLISHGGLLKLMLPLLLTNIDVQFVTEHVIDHTDCIIAELQADGLKCLQWGELQLV